MPDSEYKVEILEDGPIKKIAVNGKIYEVDYKDVYKRQKSIRQQEPRLHQGAAHHAVFRL